jgi:heptosyltransferase-2
MNHFYRTYTPPFKYSVPNFISIHLKKVSLFKRALKFYRRYLYIVIKGQKNLEVFELLPKHKKILWINVSAVSLGDSLMDLSSRVFIKDREIHLFTDKKNSNLYQDDKYFSRVYTNLKDIGEFEYDIIILDSYSSRSVKIKSKVAPKTNYVGIYGYFNGPEVNRILFSFHQMNNLLGYVYSENAVIKNAKNSIFVSSKDKITVSNIIPEEYIAIALGGEWEYKTFKKWSKVIQKILQKDEDIYIIFLGSENAKKTGIKLLNEFSNYHLMNFTSRLSFNQTAEVIKQSKVFFCCDGGLMHAAAAVNANFIPLLARLPAEMLLTQDISNYKLYDINNVNNIKVKDMLINYYQIDNQ